MVKISLDIDEDFYRQEEKCGFLVTKQRKEIWAVELDLVAQLDRVCRKYNLKYCVGAGTMLGAVRHQGFIPWDDDIDIYMIRSDYNELMKHADEFKKPYFLQNSITEKYMLKRFARLRNSETLGSTSREIHLPVDKGIFIDIFPIDGISPNRIADAWQGLWNRFYRDVFGCYNYSKTSVKPRSLKGKLSLTVYKLVAAVFVRNKQKTFQRFQRNLSRYSVDKTELWGNRTLVFACPKSRRPRKDYEDLVYMPFESIKVPVPRKYDEMLRQQYGDYMKIPKRKGENMHGDLIISTDLPYEKLKEKLG